MSYASTTTGRNATTRPSTSRVSLRALVLVVLTALSGCSPSDGSPDGAMKAFFRAVAMRDNAKVYKMLALATRKALAAWAERATEKTGGRRRFKPEELIAASVDQPRVRVGRVETIEVIGDRARVRVVGPQGKHKEVFSLVRESGHWRIELAKTFFAAPAKTPTPPASASAPARALAPASARATASKSEATSSAPATAPSRSPAGGK